MRLVLVQSESSGLFLVTHTVTHGERGRLPGGLPARGGQSGISYWFLFVLHRNKVKLWFTVLHNVAEVKSLLHNDYISEKKKQIRYTAALKSMH